MPSAFRCPSHEDDGQFHTHYLAVVGPDTAFTGSEAPRLSSISDDLANTIAVVESTESAHWMEPRDMAFDGMSFVINDPGGSALGSAHPGGVNMLMCDDSVRFLLDDTSPETVRQLLLRNDGSIVDSTQF
jgi:prepilin-type processing-associated H-X9-DG protein